VFEVFWVLVGSALVAGPNESHVTIEPRGNRFAASGFGAIGKCHNDCPRVDVSRRREQQARFASSGQHVAGLVVDNSPPRSPTIPSGVIDADSKRSPPTDFTGNRQICSGNDIMALSVLIVSLVESALAPGHD
jgi:hypothetical protein